MAIVPSVDEIAWLRDNSPAWRLLRADNAALVLSFLGRVFVTGNVRSISAAYPMLIMSASPDLAEGLSYWLTPGKSPCARAAHVRKTEAGLANGCIARVRWGIRSLLTRCAAGSTLGRGGLGFGIRVKA
jgi:uncharacterized protein DUF3375